jgi:3-hydroxybutyryl-CoA dehydratase
MGRAMSTYDIGNKIPDLTKHMTQEAINMFEWSSGESGPSQFTDEETAKGVLGTSGTVASGRMSLTFAIEMLRKFFGPEIYNRRGTVDLRFLRPVRPGDSVTFSGEVISVVKEPNGSRVSIDISVVNQKGDTTAVGQGSAVVPNAFLPEE